MCKKWQIQSFIYLPENAQMPGFCIILSSALGGLGGPRTPRLKGRSLRSLHFPSILKKNPSIQHLNETAEHFITSKHGGHGFLSV
jgi:hypothetical protein